MLINLDQETAREYLRDVEPAWRGFWFHMHLYALNLVAFLSGLKSIDDNVYLYHSEGHKNDLANWVREVIGDGELADELERVRTREEAVAMTEKRIVELKKVAGLD